MRRINQIQKNTFFYTIGIAFLWLISTVTADNLTTGSIQLTDQGGDSVAAAVVHLLVYPDADTDEASPERQSVTAQKITVKTNVEGVLKIPDLTGNIQVVSIKKDGYRITSRQIEQINKYLNQSTINPEEASPAPMNITIHKSSGPAFLRISQDTFKVHAGQPEPVYLDMQSGRNKTQAILKKAKKTKEPIAKGLVINTEVDAKKKAYILNFSCPEDAGGIIISAEYFFEAPADGYDSQAVINVPYATDRAIGRKLYAYIKALAKQPDQWQYSRIEMDFMVGKSALIADITSYINPTGSRNLEYDSKYQAKQQAQLRKQFQEAMEASTNPEKIKNLRQMVDSDGETRDFDPQRWNFQSKTRRTQKQQRQRKLEAEGRLRQRQETK